MPPIVDFLKDNGWVKSGSLFFYPSGDGPHLHLTVSNAQVGIAGYASLRTENQISYFGLTQLPGGNLDFFANNTFVTAAVLPDATILAAINNTGWNAAQQGNARSIINSITGRNV